MAEKSLNEGRELYLEANNGKIQMWKADISSELTQEGFVTITATYGMTDGKKQTKDTFVKSGKNIGKKNETSIHEQAVLKLDQMYADKIKNKSMVFDIADWVRPMRPSLAMAYHKREKYVQHIEYWLADEKLDGNRAYEFWDGSVQSKSGDVTTPIAHIAKSMVKLKEIAKQKGLPEINFDGEYYLHGVDLQDITGISNTKNDEDRRTDILLEYHIFGCYVPSEPLMSAKKRYELLLELFDGVDLEFLVLRKKTVIKNNREDIKAFTRKCELAGYEGSILLDPNAPYNHSKNPSDRNDSMFKDKNMQDDEFLIVDIIENENEVGIPKFIIQLPNGETCEVVMKGKKEKAKEYWTNREKYIGKYLKVQYQTYTKYGKLEFPVGLEIREGKMTEHGFDGRF